MIRKVDRKNQFVSLFNPDTGYYLRAGFKEDPFMADFPELIDVGVMGHCKHGKSGLCLKAGIECYQSGATQYLPNMTLDNFKRIVDECK